MSPRRARHPKRAVGAPLKLLSGAGLLPSRLSKFRHRPRPLSNFNGREDLARRNATDAALGLTTPLTPEAAREVGKNFTRRASASAAGRKGPGSFDRERAAQNLRAEVFKPREVLRDHVELKQVLARRLGRAQGDLDLGGLAGRHVRG